MKRFQGKVFHCYCSGHVVSVNGYIGSTSIIVNVEDAINREYEVQIQGSNPTYYIILNVENGVLTPKITGGDSYGCHFIVTRIF
ncbi:MAG: hypothetical protein ACRC0S_03995 [Fusobacteriaceae bacterium]